MLRTQVSFNEVADSSALIGTAFKGVEATTLEDMSDAFSPLIDFCINNPDDSEMAQCFINIAALAKYNLKNEAEFLGDNNCKPIIDRANFILGAVQKVDPENRKLWLQVDLTKIALDCQIAIDSGRVSVPPEPSI